MMTPEDEMRCALLDLPGVYGEALPAYRNLLAFMHATSAPGSHRDFDEMWKLLPPPPWDYAPLEALDRAGFTDFGVSMRTGWLTEKGIKALEFIAEHGEDPEAW